MYKLDQPPLLFESSRPGRATAILPESDVPDRPLDDADSPPRTAPRRRPPLPELSELDVVRHYTNLSTLNMSIDANFYPLGSCTMKYNPKRNERLAALAGPGRPASLSGREHAPGAAGDPLRAPGDPRRDRRAARRQPAAGGRRAGRADRAAGRRGLLPRPGRDADAGPDPRQRPRHQPRLGPPGRVRGGHDQEQQPRPGRPRRLQGQARATRRPCS